MFGSQIEIANLVGKARGQEGDAWWVTKSGSDSAGGHSLAEAFLTVAAAIAAAGTYDTINIGPGTYAENLTIGSGADPNSKEGLRLIGTYRNVLAPRWIRISASGTDATLSIRSKFVEIAGLTFETPNQAVVITNPHYPQLAGACIEMVNEAITGGTANYGDAQYTHIHDCAFRVTGSGNVGIMSWAAQMSLIEGCWFRNLDYGVYMGPSYSYNSWYNQVRDCFFLGCLYPIGVTLTSPGEPGAQNTTIGPGNVFGHSNSQDITKVIKLGLSTTDGRCVGNYMGCAKTDGVDVNKATAETATFYLAGNEYIDGVEPRS